MTRKDYEKLANAMHEVLAESDLKSVDQLDGNDEVIHAVVGVLAADNPRFNEQRFYDVVYGKGRNTAL